MTWAIYGAFFFTVALLFFTAYFLLGGLPLLILKHDAPLDAKFVHSLFNVYYRVSFWAALGAAASYVLWGRVAFGAGAVVIAVVVTLMRKFLLGAMDEVGTQIEGGDSAPIQRFRRMHGAALLINLALLVFLVWGTIQLSRSL